MPAGTVQDHLQSLFLCAVGCTGGCSAGLVEAIEEGAGFPVLCRMYVAPENKTPAPQLAQTRAPVRLTSRGGTGCPGRTAGFVCSSNPRAHTTSQEGFAELSVMCL